MSMRGALQQFTSVTMVKCFRHQRIGLWNWLLSVTVIVAIILSAITHSESRADTHKMGGNFITSTVLGDHCVPTQKSSPGEKTHHHCGLGGSCFQFVLADQQTFIRVPRKESVIAVQMPMLATRSIAPPLPPPIFPIIA